MPPYTLTFEPQFYLDAFLSTIVIIYNLYGQDLREITFRAACPSSLLFPSENLLELADCPRTC